MLSEPERKIVWKTGSSENGLWFSFGTISWNDNHIGDNSARKTCRWLNWRRGKKRILIQGERRITQPREMVLNEQTYCVWNAARWLIIPLCNFSVFFQWTSYKSCKPYLDPKFIGHGWLLSDINGILCRFFKLYHFAKWKIWKCFFFFFKICHAQPLNKVLGY